MSKIDLATYVAKVEVDSSGLSSGLGEADKGIRSGIGGLVNWSKVALAGMLAGIGASAVKLGKESIDAFATVEQEMNRVFTLLPPMSKQAKDEMTQDARDLALEMGKLPEDVIPAIYSALSAGVPKDNVFDYVETATKMAVAGGTEAEVAVEGLAAVLNAYNMDASEADKISDMFFVTLKNGMTSVEELSHSLSNVTPIASAMGIEFEEVAGALATMTAQGIPTATATNQIKAMLSELNKEGSVSSDTFKEIAGKSFPDFIKSGGTLAEALQMMDKHAEDSNTTISNLFGSVNAGQGALALTGDNMNSFTDDIDAMRNSAGATDEAFEEMNQGINRFKEVLESTVAYIKYEIGEVLAPIVGAFFDMLADGLEFIIDLIKMFKGETDEVVEDTKEDVSELTEGLDAMGETINDIITPFEEFNNAIADLGIETTTTKDMIQEAVDGVKEIFSTLVEFIGDVVADLKLFMADLVDDNKEQLENIMDTIFTILGQIKDFIVGFIEYVSKIWEMFWRNYGNTVKVIFEFVIDVIEKGLEIIQGILDVFIGIFTGDWERMWDGVLQIVKGIFKLLFSLVKNSLKTIVNILGSMITSFFEVTGRLFMAVFNAAKEVLGRLVKWITTPIRAIFSAFTSSYGEARSAGKGMFESVWEGMKGIWTSIASWVSSKVSWLTDKLAFWRKGQNEMRDDGGGRGSSGSFATGTRLIKKDGYNLLHKGEAVIPANLNPFNPKNTNKGGFFSGKFGGSGDGGNPIYDVDINIDKVDSGVDIEKAVDRGIEKAERKRKARLKKKGI